MSSHYPWKLVLVSSLVSAALMVLTYQLAQTVFLSPDTIGLACGAEQLFTTGEFSSARTPYPMFDYVPCWTGQIYPALQIFVASFRFALPSIALAVGATHVLLAMLFPLVVSTLVWNYKHNRQLTYWAALLAALLPAAHSTLQLTPQGSLGTILLLAALSLVIRPGVPITRWLLVVPVLIVLFFTHTLTFFFAMIFVGLVWLIHKPLKHSILFFIGSVLVGVLGSLAALARTSSIKTIAIGLWEQLQVIDQFQQRPIWDHASVFGYVIIPLVIFGFTAAVWTRKDKILLGLWLFIPLVASHLDIFGLSFLPHRMVWYMAPAVLLLAASGMQTILDHRRSVLFIVTNMAIILSLAAQTIFLSQNNVETYVEPIKLTDSYQEVVLHLTDIPSDQVILVVMTPQDRQALHLPIYTEADVISFPAHQFKSTKNFELSQPFWAYLAENRPGDPLIERLKAVNQMLEQPQLSKQQDLYNAYHITRIVLKKGSSQAKTLRKSNLFTEVFENDTYLILQP